MLWGLAAGSAALFVALVARAFLGPVRSRRQSYTPPPPKAVRQRQRRGVVVYQDPKPIPPSNGPGAQA